MKTVQPRMPALVQRDLFDSAAPSTALSSLQLHHDELVELLSRLLWQVARGADQREENTDEQDQP